MMYTRIYADKNGETHFEDVTVNMTDSRHARLSEMIAAKGVIFRLTKDYFVDWHPAPRRQYIVNLDAGVKITASDGESRMIGTGEILLVEDTTGKGHLSQHYENKIRHSIFIPIE